MGVDETITHTCEVVAVLVSPGLWVPSRGLNEAPSLRRGIVEDISHRRRSFGKGEYRSSERFGGFVIGQSDCVMWLCEDDSGGRRHLLNLDGCENQYHPIAVFFASHTCWMENDATTTKPPIINPAEQNMTPLG